MCHDSRTPFHVAPYTCTSSVHVYLRIQLPRFLMIMAWHGMDWSSIVLGVQFAFVFLALPWPLYIAPSTPTSDHTPRSHPLISRRGSTALASASRQSLPLAWDSSLHRRRQWLMYVARSSILFRMLGPIHGPLDRSIGSSFDHDLLLRVLCDLI